MNPKQRQRQRELLNAMGGVRHMRQIEADVARRFADILKPRPSWCPDWLWKWMAGLFLNLD